MESSLSCSFHLYSIYVYQENGYLVTMPKAVLNNRYDTIICVCVYLPKIQTPWRKQLEDVAQTQNPIYVCRTYKENDYLVSMAKEKNGQM